MEFVELGALTERDWAELEAGEHQPFGPVGAGLEWQPKERHIGLRAADGTLLAVAGVLVAGVVIEGAGSFDVVGLGSLIVTHSRRGHGLMSRLVGPTLQLAASLGPEHAMIFCRAELVELYEGLQFAPIGDPVWADQPQGPMQMPMSVMWRALRVGAVWPPGRVDVQGLPF